MKPALFAGFIFVGSLFFVPIPLAAQSEPASASFAEKNRQKPIKSLRELNDYLQTHAKGGTPFDAFSPAGRTRFVDGLAFNDSGLAGYNYSELKEELSFNDIQSVLALFGMEPYSFLQDNARPFSVGSKPIEIPSGLIGQNYEIFHKQNTPTSHSEQERARLVSSQFDALFKNEVTGPKLKTANGADLQLLFRAANSTAFVTADPRHLEVMARVLDELQSRGLALPNHYADMHATYVQARMFEEASRLSSDHPSVVVESVPTLQEAAGAGAGGPTELVVSAERRELMRQPVALDLPVQIVVIAHPLCHFSQDASRDIKADPVLNAIFQDHAKWVAPQGRDLKFDLFQEWNREHPDQAMTLVYKRDEWPMIDSWGTPTFYFLKAGTLIAKVQGWPREGRSEDLLAALRKVGSL